MKPPVIATVEETRAGTAASLAVMEIDELVPVHLDSAVLYYHRIVVEPIEPEWEIELQ